MSKFKDSILLIDTEEIKTYEPQKKEGAFPPLLFDFEYTIDKRKYTKSQRVVYKITAYTKNPNTIANPTHYRVMGKTAEDEDIVVSKTAFCEDGVYNMFMAKCADKEILTTDKSEREKQFALYETIIKGN